METKKLEAEWALSNIELKRKIRQRGKRINEKGTVGNFMEKTKRGINRRSCKDEVVA